MYSLPCKALTFVAKIKYPAYNELILFLIWVISIKQSQNINELEFIGKGSQGKVYKINSQKCIKIFKNKKSCRDEVKTLLMAQSDIHFPKIFKFGEKYIIREFINGIELNEYLSKHKLSPGLSSKLIELYESMVNVGYTRHDAAIFHIFIMPSGELKLIDTAKAMKKKSVIPNLLISGLEDLGYKEDFFNFLKSNKSDLYKKWINYTKIEYKKVY
jgi:predicted Ser/Thr protein kinase